MWSDNKRLFFLSGIASFSVFFIVLALILWQASLVVRPIMYSASKSNFIAISLEASSPSAKAKVSTQSQKPQEKPKEKPYEKVVVKESVTKEEIVARKSLPQEKSPPAKASQPEINDLFATVKTVHPSKSMQKKSSELNAFEKEILSSKRSSGLFEKAKSFQLAKSSVKFINKGSGSPIVNEYYAKVQKVIYAHFHPAAGTQGFKADVLMVLTSEGKLISFRVVHSSGNSLFDAELELLNERLKRIALPKNPMGESATFEIILSAKE